MVATVCPTPEELKNYTLGRLAEKDWQAIADHVESCPQCQTAIATVDDVADTLVTQLRGPAPADSFLNESQCEAALKRAQEIVGATGSASAVGATGSASAAPVFAEFGEYQILEELGQGGMGAVYKALHKKLDRVVAIKILSRGRAGDQRAIARFEREMKAIGRFDHPHIVRAYDAREIDGAPVLIMEFVEGMDLGRLVQRLGPVPTAEACELVRQAAVGLQYVHERGMVHRDLKPSNLMLTPQGVVKILDLGLARFHFDQPMGTGSERSEVPVPFSGSERSEVPVPFSGFELTNSGQAMGTADYMAPEQASDSHAVDIRADIYSLGCTLYKLLAGCAPFECSQYKGTFEKMTAHVQHPAPPIENLLPEIPRQLAAIMGKMLAKNPADRFAQPSEVVEAIAPFCAGANLVELNHKATISVSPLSLRERARVRADQVEGTSKPASQPRRRTWAAIAIGLMMLGLGFSLGIMVMIKRDGKTTAIEAPEGSNVRVNDQGDVTVDMDAIKKEVAGNERLAKISLADAVGSFNLRAAHNPIGKDQPPLTEDEIIEAIKLAIFEKDKLHVSNKTLEILKSIIESRELPEGFEIEFITHFKPDERTESIKWSVRLRIPAYPGLTTCIMIRDKTISSQYIAPTINASGTIEPKEVVDVTAQVSGRIVSLGEDPRGATDPKFKGKPIDFNSLVEEGTVLARIDDTIYKLRVEQEEANYKHVEFTYNLMEQRHKAGTASETEFIAAAAAFEKSKAAIKEAKINLENTVIKSPVKGLIIARRVNVGQNVAPDPKSHALFAIVKDLGRMQIRALVNEADIGRIHEGMTAKFYVDAFPKDVFEGKVTQIRHDVIINHNYTVMVAFDNSDNKLLPYMTANLKFEIEKVQSPSSTRLGRVGVDAGMEPTTPEFHRIDLSTGDGKAAVPPEPYTIWPGDSLNIRAMGTLTEAPIDGVYMVEPEGTVVLGPAYGRVNVKDMSLVEAEQAIVKHLKEILRQPEVSVTLASWVDRSKPQPPPQPHRIAPGDILDIGVNGTIVDQPINGPYLVEPDGQVSLGPAYGRVNLKGQTFEEAQNTVTKQLQQILRAPEVLITLEGWGKVRKPTVEEELKKELEKAKKSIERLQRANRSREVQPPKQPEKGKKPSAENAPVESANNQNPIAAAAVEIPALTSSTKIQTTKDGKIDKESFLSLLRDNAAKQSKAMKSGQCSYKSVTKVWRDGLGEKYNKDPSTINMQGKIIFDGVNFRLDAEVGYEPPGPDRKNIERHTILTKKWLAEKDSSIIRLYDPPGDFRSDRFDPRAIAKAFIGDSERLDIKKVTCDGRMCFRIEEVPPGAGVRTVQIHDPEKDFVLLRREMYYDNASREASKKLRDDYPFEVQMFEYRKEKSSGVWISIKCLEQNFETISLAEKRNPTLDSEITSEFDDYSFVKPPAKLFTLYNLSLLGANRLRDNRKGSSTGNWYDLPSRRNLADSTYVPDPKGLPSDLMEEWIKDAAEER